MGEEGGRTASLSPQMHSPMNPKQHGMGGENGEIYAEGKA